MSATRAPLSRPQVLGYALLGLPLAMAALPVYLHAPRFYAEVTALGLGAIGLVIGLARLVDAVTDPWLGSLIDRHCAERGRRWALPFGIPLLVAGMLALFHPASGDWAAAWLLASLVLVSLGYSVVSIAYQALAADLHPGPHQRSRLAAAREGLGLVGVLLAALLPGWLAAGQQHGFGRFGLVQGALLVAVALVCWRFLRAPAPAARAAAASPLPAERGSLRRALGDPALRTLLTVLLLSAGAGALTATLFPFFVADVLAAPGHVGLLLAAYFAAGALGMPLWVAAGRRLGKPAAWLAGMLTASVAFAGTAWLGPGDETLFLGLCLLSGLALGADLALASALLADLAHPDAARDPHGQGGVYFGLWNFVLKLALGLAAALALPLVAWLGYVPGDQASAATPLRFAYVLLPLALKLAAAGLLYQALVRGRPASPALARSRPACP